MTCALCGVTCALVAGCGSSAPEGASGPPRAPLESSVGLAPVVRTGVGVELLLVPPGDFKRGSEEGPDNERPVRRVRITRPYYMGRTEVTQGQFGRFVAETGYRTTAERGGGAKVWRGKAWVLDPSASFRTVFPGEDRPAVAVSWDDAVAFCAWLTERERSARTIGPTQVIRLPTEAEWEYAARAGTRERYAGTDRDEDVCRHGNGPDEAAAREGLGRHALPCDDGVGIGTAPVGRYMPNALGLYDMSGNVWEWVADRYGPYPGGEGLVVNPTGPVAGEGEGEGEKDLRVMRGGSWSGKTHGLQVSHRDGYPPSLNGGAIGFRVAMSAQPEGGRGSPELASGALLFAVADHDEAVAAEGVVLRADGAPRVGVGGRAEERGQPGVVVLFAGFLFFLRPLVPRHLRDRAHLVELDGAELSVVEAQRHPEAAAEEELPVQAVARPPRARRERLGAAGEGRAQEVSLRGRRADAEVGRELELAGVRVDHVGH